ncbi:MAG: endonuclease III, partial [Desulfuromonas sp.]|nr:endonuclease III [Desulfuromonas sp.]
MDKVDNFRNPGASAAAGTVRNLSRRHALLTLLQLEHAYPDATCALLHNSPWQLLVATILSAQCTDTRVNLVTPALFARFPDPVSLAGASPDEVEELIRSTGFFRNKAASLIGCARAVVERYQGRVPRTLAELVELPGVGRKTANVLLGNAFAVPGMVVDTHVGRVARRLGWARAANPQGVERELCALLPKAKWTQTSHVLIWHGRRCCRAQIAQFSS